MANGTSPPRRTNTDLITLARKRWTAARHAFDAGDRIEGWVHLLAMQMDVAAAEHTSGEIRWQFDIVQIARDAGLLA